MRLLAAIALTALTACESVDRPLRYDELTRQEQDRLELAAAETRLEAFRQTKPLQIEAHSLESQAVGIPKTRADRLATDRYYERVEETKDLIHQLRDSLDGQ